MKGALAAILSLSLLGGAAFGQGTTATKAATPDDKADKLGLDASKVTVKLKDVPLDEILQVMAEQSGNSHMQIPDNWEAQNVTFEAVDMTYWQALDKLCAQLKLCYVVQTTGQARDRKTELALVDGKGFECVSSYCGPVVVKLAGVTTTKRYLPVPAGAESNALEVSLAWFCEDRLRPLDVKAEVTKLVGADGKELALASAAAEGQGQPQAMIQGAVIVQGGVVRFTDASGIRGASPALSTAGAVTAKVAALPKDVRAVKSLEGVVRMTFAHGMKELKVADVFGGKNDAAEAGKDKLSVTVARRQMNWSNLTIELTSDGKAVDLAGLSATAPYGAKLIDPNGEAHAPTNLRTIPMMGPRGGIQIQGGANVQVQVQVGPDGGAPVPAVKAPAEGGAQSSPVSVMFAGLPNVDGEWTLVVTVPETRAAKDFTFTLNDIALP